MKMNLDIWFINFFGDIQTVDREKKEIIYNKQIESNPNQAPHVYSYIIDYSFTQVLDKIVQIHFH